jgi:quercetin dioxygenase-like cupin family protein
MSRFVLQGDVPTTEFDWGNAGMRCDPPGTGCSSFVVMDVTLIGGACHAFHKHPDQDEMIIVKSGRIVQYLEHDHAELGPGDSVYIDKDVVHGSYNDFGETAELQVVLAPPIGDGGYELVDVSGEEPWATARAASP